MVELKESCETCKHIDVPTQKFPCWDCKYNAANTCTAHFNGSYFTQARKEYLFDLLD